MPSDPIRATVTVGPVSAETRAVVDQIMAVINEACELLPPHLRTLFLLTRPAAPRLTDPLQSWQHYAAEVADHCEDFSKLVAALNTITARAAASRCRRVH